MKAFQTPCGPRNIQFRLPAHGGGHRRRRGRFSLTRRSLVARSLSDDDAGRFDATAMIGAAWKVAGPAGGQCPSIRSNCSCVPLIQPGGNPRDRRRPSSAMPAGSRPKPQTAFSTVSSARASLLEPHHDEQPNDSHFRRYPDLHDGPRCPAGQRGPRPARLLIDAARRQKLTNEGRPTMLKGVVFGSLPRLTR